MNTSLITNIISEYEELPYNDKIFVLEIFQKQVIEAKRDAIRERADEAMSNYHISAVKKGSLNDLLSDIDDD
ncbi:MAG: hypothetical protein A2015_06205 [Spirochaetes bacterium GWF1_31_7]|nr:MAG: hypothetical protein A2015_06205 [Spirochaetes bacterium GWF1_31_7]OHD81375.1 MAG: hypothetical protein A2355_17590 [Spirochaetes bacterium RIFOXYB1_FULL_32_8]HBI36016.1 hypothetical protein [Spirochaetia bacterium]